MKTNILHRCYLAIAIALFANVGFTAELEESAGVLEEVTVVATRRSESIQDVPVSVTAIGSDLMAKVQIEDMEDLSLFVPNFEINSVQVVPNLYIRGLGGGLTHSTEQSVGRFVDDVYIGRAAINLLPFIDVASVEVLRGPQGTLFGKNTAAGALIMRTNDPTQEFDSGINISYGGYETTGHVAEVNGFVSGGLSDSVSGRLAFMYRDRDGFYENLGDGPDGAQREDWGFIGKLRFEVSDSTTMGLKVQYQDYTEDGSDSGEMNTAGMPTFLLQSLAANSGAPNADQFTPVLDWVIHHTCSDVLSTPGAGSVPIGSFCPGRDMDATNITFDVDHDIDAGSFKFIAAYQDYSYESRFHGFEGGVANLFRAFRDEDYESLSAELRFTSEVGDVFDYIVGLYYEDSDIDRTQDSDINLVGFGPPFLFRKHDPWSQATETFAAFAQVRWHFTDRVTGIFGARWSTETKDFEFEEWNTAYGTDDGPRMPVVLLRTEDRDEDKFTPSFTLQADVNDEIMVFGTYSQGHKTGGFSDRVDTQTGDIKFDSEDIDNFELGMKSSLLNGAMNLNITFFHMNIEGLQLSTQVPNTINFVVGNAADSTSKGVELESAWAVNENWTLGFNYAYTDATYDEYIGAGNCGEQYKNEDGVCDLSGATLQYAPKHKFSASVDYFKTDTFGGWDFGGRFDWSYADDQYTDVGLFDFAFSEAHSLFGASLRLISPSDKITLYLIGRNLGNKKVNAWTAPSGPNTIATMNAPRQLTLKLAWRY